MADLQVKKEEDLKDCAQPFDDNKNYQLAYSFGNDDVRKKLQGYIDQINSKNERLTTIYNELVHEMEIANSEELYKAVARKFEQIKGFRDVDSLAIQCTEKAETCRKDDIFNKAFKAAEKDTIEGNGKAIEILNQISEWKDADQRIKEWQAAIERIKTNQLNEQYNIAAKKMKQSSSQEEYLDAANVFEKIRGFMDADQLIDECQKRAEDCRKDQIYMQAIKAMELAFMLKNDIEKYKRAIELFSQIPGWKDADARIETCQRSLEQVVRGIQSKRTKFVRNTMIAIMSCIILIVLFGSLRNSTGSDNMIFGKANVISAVGDRYVFGNYEQDNDTSNGKEPIVWRVLAIEGGRALLISEYALDCKQFNWKWEDVTWEKCTLRIWLNGTDEGDFLRKAFSEEERKRIAATHVKAHKNPSYDTDPGNDTEDQIFLLSIEEATRYFKDNEDRKCVPTEYAVDNGLYVNHEGFCWWWLRSPGYNRNYAAVVDLDGGIDAIGFGVNRDSVGVRPALWINL